MEKQKENNEEVVDISRSMDLKKAASDATENKGVNKNIEYMEVSSASLPPNPPPPRVRATATAIASSSSSSSSSSFDVADDDENSVLDAKGLLPRKKLCFENLDGTRGSKATASELCVSSDGEEENLKENSDERSNETSNSVGNISAVETRKWDMKSYYPILCAEFPVNKDTVVKVKLVADYKFTDLKRVILILNSVTRSIFLVEPWWVLKHGFRTIKSCFGRKSIQPSEKKTMEITGSEVEVIKDDLYATPYSGNHVMLRQKSNKYLHPDETLYLSGATWASILRLLPVLKGVLRTYENMVIEDHPFMDHYVESPLSDYIENRKSQSQTQIKY